MYMVMQFISNYIFSLEYHGGIQYFSGRMCYGTCCNKFKTNLSLIVRKYVASMTQQCFNFATRVTFNNSTHLIQLLFIDIKHQYILDMVKKHGMQTVCPLPFTGLREPTPKEQTRHLQPMQVYTIYCTDSLTVAKIEYINKGRSIVSFLYWCSIKVRSL